MKEITTRELCRQYDAARAAAVGTKDQSLIEEKYRLWDEILQRRIDYAGERMHCVPIPSVDEVIEAEEEMKK